MSDYEELFERCLLAVYDADKAATEWPNVTPMKAQRIALLAIEPLILEALKAKDEENGALRGINSGALRTGWKAGQEQAEHRLAEALKHLEALTEFLPTFGHKGSHCFYCEWYLNGEPEHADDCPYLGASNFLKAQTPTNA